MSASTVHQASVLTGRQMMLLVVIGLHALVIAALMTMRIAVDTRPVTTVFKPLTDIDRPEPPPPDVRPVLAVEELRPGPILPSLVPPDLQVVTELRWVAPDTPMPLPGDPAAGVDVAPALALPATPLAYEATRSPDDYYPALSIRLQEQGVAVVRVCVAADGRIDGRPVVERSAGSRHLDAAAVRWASEALVFTPATRDGAPVPACKGFRVNFSLR